MMRGLMLAVLLGWMAQAMAADVDFSGKWHGEDGSTYYVRQIGDEIYWYAEGSQEVRRSSSIFVGKLRAGMILGSWVDVPKGGAAAGRGELHLSIHEKGNVLEASRVTGGFPSTKIVRAGFKLPPPPVQAECLDFDPDKLSVRGKDGKFQIVQDDWWLFDFASRDTEAYAALKIIQQYRMNQSCFIGKPDPVFRFLLVGGRAPLGQVYDEDCVPFHPTIAAVAERDGRWLIIDSDQVVFDFGTRASEAKAALAAIKQHQFTHVCYIGRPNPSFQYLRR